MPDHGTGTELLEPDPPVRTDGLCIVCLKPRHPERSKKYGGDVAELDPFRKTECARSYFGCPLPPVEHGGPVKRYSEAVA